MYINLNYEYFLSIITGIVVPLYVNFSSNDNGSPNNSRNPDRNNNSENHENPSSNPNDNVQGSDPMDVDQENGDPMDVDQESGDPMDVDENNNNDEDVDYYDGEDEKDTSDTDDVHEVAENNAPKQVLKDLATLNEAKRNNNPEALNEIKKQYEQFFLDDDGEKLPDEEGIGYLEEYLKSEYPKEYKKSELETKIEEATSKAENHRKNANYLEQVAEETSDVDEKEKLKKDAKHLRDSAEDFEKKQMRRRKS